MLKAIINFKNISPLKSISNNHTNKFLVNGFTKSYHTQLNCFTISTKKFNTKSLRFISKYPYSIINMN